MKCADPVLCYRTSSGAQYRHFSLANRLFKNLANQVFDCGKCIHCRKKRARELATRCVLHASLYPDNCFLTLTYDETRTDYHNDFNYKDIQDFKKRLRKYNDRYYGTRIQIFNVHEYGKNSKKHWHLVVFNFQFYDREHFKKKNGNTLYTSPTLTELWPYGHSTIGDVSEASAMYQAQYTQKDLKHGNTNNEKRSHSKHSGIGRDFFMENFRQIMQLGYIPFKGSKIPIPRYFQKLAHKHYCHFYDESAFVTYPHRAALYSRLPANKANKELADLYRKFSETKQDRIEILEENWAKIMDQHLATNQPPDFVVSSQNYMHDLLNKPTSSKF